MATGRYSQFYWNCTQPAVEKKKQHVKLSQKKKCLFPSQLSEIFLLPSQLAEFFQNNSWFKNTKKKNKLKNKNKQELRKEKNVWLFFFIIVLHFSFKKFPYICFLLPKIFLFAIRTSCQSKRILTRLVLFNASVFRYTFVYCVTYYWINLNN